MLGAIKNYKKYCIYYKYITAIFLVFSILFILLSFYFMSNANLNISIQLLMNGIFYFIAYFQTRLMLSMCLD